MIARVVALVCLAAAGCSSGPKCDSTTEIDVTVQHAVSSSNCVSVCPAAPSGYEFGTTCVVTTPGPPATVVCYYRSAPCPG
jgi:hypothetical protein